MANYNGSSFASHGIDPSLIDTTTHYWRPCSPDSSTDHGYFGLRVAAIFVTGFTSAIGTCMPIVFKRNERIKDSLHPFVYDFAQYFGTGVIIATSFIHLIEEGLGALSSQCVDPFWTQYAWGSALVMTSMFAMFLIDFFAQRYAYFYLDSRRRARRERATTDALAPSPQLEAATILDSVIARPVSSHPPIFLPSSSRASGTLDDGATTTSGTETPPQHMIVSHQRRATFALKEKAALEAEEDHKRRGLFDTLHEAQKEALNNLLPGNLPAEDAELAAQDAKDQRDDILAATLNVILLDGSVLAHSVMIGLNLSVMASHGFPTFLVVIVFHQAFEGLGLGARLSLIPFPKGSWTPWVIAGSFSIVTPLGQAIGLGLRSSYAAGSHQVVLTTAFVGVITGGILLWTGVVGLLSRGFFREDVMREPLGVLAWRLGCLLAGAACMGLIGKYA